MMQPKQILFITIVSFTMQCAQRNNKTSEDEKLIREARQRSNEAIAQQDTTALGNVWTSDYHIISSRNFEISGMENNRNNFKRSSPARRSYFM